MATTGGNGGPAPGPSTPQGQAQLSVLGQYIKDFSFENPNAPRSLAPNQTQPAINIQINVSAQQLAQTDYEISLKLEGKAESAGTILFAFDLTFAGVFRLQNVPAETLQPIVMIECPGRAAGGGSPRYAPRLRRSRARTGTTDAGTRS